MKLYTPSERFRRRGSPKAGDPPDQSYPSRYSAAFDSPYDSLDTIPSDHSQILSIFIHFLSIVIENFWKKSKTEVVFLNFVENFVENFVNQKFETK